MRQQHTAIRIPAEALRRADALAPALQRAPELAAFRFGTRASVLRLALVEGLAVLEARHGGRAKRKG